MSDVIAICGAAARQAHTPAAMSVPWINRASSEPPVPIGGSGIIASAVSAPVFRTTAPNQAATGSVIGTAATSLDNEVIAPVGLQPRHIPREKLARQRGQLQQLGQLALDLALAARHGERQVDLALPVLVRGLGAHA